MNLSADLSRKVAVVVTDGGRQAVEMENDRQKGRSTGSAFDVYNHTVDGMAAQMSKAIDDPVSALSHDPVHQAEMVKAMAPDNWESSKLDQALKAVDQQKAELNKQMDAVGTSKGALATAGAGFAVLTTVEQMISTMMSVLPFPAFPAVRVTDFDVGLPHAHSHPPNLTPPNPVPVPLPSTGPVIPIPFISGATRALINGLPAARCGDMGLGIWCGGYFPMYEIFLGSSNVWIEGARAARLAVDVTWHCIFSVPKPSDPPLGPMTGMTISASPNVHIGGVPMPSLLNLAMGGAMKALSHGFGKLVKKLKAGKAAKNADITPSFSRSAQSNLDEITQPRIIAPSSIDYGLDAYQRASRFIDSLENAKSIVIQGNPVFKEAVRKDLRRLACSKTGREVLEDIHHSINKAVIQPQDWAPKASWKKGAHAQPKDDFYNIAGTFDDPGGCDTYVRYDPFGGHPDSPPDVTLVHELGHARNFANGTSRKGKTNGMDAQQKARWTDWEEVDVINDVDNPYRRERGLRERHGHNHLPVSH